DAVAEMIAERYADPEEFAALEHDVLNQVARRSGDLATALQKRADEVDARLTELGRDIDQGHRNLAIIPPDLVAAVAAKVQEMQLEREPLTPQRPELQTAAPAHAADAGRVAEALAALRKLGEAVASGRPERVRRVLTLTCETITVRFDRTRPRNQTRAVEV